MIRKVKNVKEYKINKYSYVKIGINNIQYILEEKCFNFVY